MRMPPSALILPLLRPFTTLILAVTFAVPLAIRAEGGPKLYRWVDDQGNVHYTDQVPPSQIKQGRTTLSQDGLRTDTVAPELTGEALKQAEEEKRRAEEIVRRKEEERATDKRLIQTYRSTDELVLAREGRIAGIEAAIQVKRDLLRREQDHLVQIAADRQKAIRARKPIPDELGKEIERSQRNIRDGYAAIIQLESDKDSVRQEFAATIQRYKRLKKLPDDKQGDQAVAARPLPNMVSCQGGDQCRALWERASAYLRARSDKDKEISGSGLLIGFQKDPREEHRLALSWTQKSPTAPVNIFFDLQCKNRLTASLVCTGADALKAREEFRSTVLQSSGPDTSTP